VDAGNATGYGGDPQPSRRAWDVPRRLGGSCRRARVTWAAVNLRALPGIARSRGWFGCAQFGLESGEDRANAEVEGGVGFLGR
jgi:hypothetical protein